MKKYLLYLLLAFTAISFTACEEDAEPMGTTVSTDVTSISFNGQGASPQTISVLANGDWIAVTPDWITVSPNYGSGNTQVQVTVADNLDTDGTLAAERSGEISFTLNGNPSIVTVLQAGDPAKKPAEIKKITVAEFNAAAEDPSVFYELTGVIANISNLKYGNFDLIDETGSVYVYGLYESKTNTDNYAFERLGLAEGDKITLHGYRGSYGDKIEVMGAYYVSHEASLISATPKEVELPIEGGNFDIKLAYKGETFEVAINEEARGWLTMGAILPQEDTTVISFSVPANAGGAREATISFTTTKGSESTTINTTVKQEGSIVDITIADFLAKEDGSSLYRLSGKVKSIVNDTYGNIYLEDATGEVYVYGITATPVLGQSNDKSFKSLGVQVGDILTIVGTRASYNGSAQVGGPAYYVEHTSHVEANVATVLAASTGDTYYKITGTVANIKSDVYGNFDLVDETGSIYVYGLTKAPVAKNDKSFGSLGIKEGDKLTLIGKRGEYNGPQIVSAYYVSHEAGQGGGEDENTITDATIKDFLAQEVNDTKLYRLTGKIADIANDTYGNVTIEDATGSVYVYGIKAAVDADSKSFSTLGLKVGDIVTVVGVRAAYGDTQQAKNTYYEKHIAYKTLAEMNEMAVGDTFYAMSGNIKEIKNDAYGNITIEDATGSIYVYGVKASADAGNQSFKELGLKVNDNVTIIGKRGEYNGSAQIAGAYYFCHKSAE